jgi:hypothetical protein
MFSIIVLAFGNKYYINIEAVFCWITLANFYNCYNEPLVLFLIF